MSSGFEAKWYKSVQQMQLPRKRMTSVRLLCPSSMKGEKMKEKEEQQKEAAQCNTSHTKHEVAHA